MGGRHQAHGKADPGNDRCFARSHGRSRSDSCGAGLAAIAHGSRSRSLRAASVRGRPRCRSDLVELRRGKYEERAASFVAMIPVACRRRPRTWIMPAAMTSSLNRNGATGKFFEGLRHDESVRSNRCGGVAKIARQREAGPSRDSAGVRVGFAGLVNLPRRYVRNGRAQGFDLLGGCSRPCDDREAHPTPGRA